MGFVIILFAEFFCEPNGTKISPPNLSDRPQNVQRDHVAGTLPDRVETGLPISVVFGGFGVFFWRFGAFWGVF